VLAASRPATPRRGLAAVATLRRRLDELEAANVDFGLRAGLSWSQIASALGVSKQAAHRRHAGRARAAGVKPGTGAVVSGSARQAVAVARQATAGALGSAQLMLGALHEESGGPCIALGSLTSVSRTREALRAVPAEGEPGLVSEPARRSLEQSLREAVRLGSQRLEVEHLALAVLRDRDGPVARALEEAGTTAEQLEDALLERLGAG
jgi:DNA-binding Lrp family transcriptional regulator